MSKTGCSGGFTAKRARFKGVENFLKRVAYNLGNSPSQTDVKIISCIPIDVSDLQQKIICLEKQLQETKCFQMSNMEQRPIINTALCEFPRMLNTGVSCNMLDTNRSTSPCPPCRGAHNHHRRFTKKNSNVSFVEPSGKRACTCHLEESVECSCSQAEKLMSEEKCYPYLSWDNNSPCMGGDSKPRGYRKSIFSRKNKCCKYKKPKTQCVYYAQTRSTPFNTTANQSKTVSKRLRVMSRSYLAEMINKQYKPRQLGGNISEISNFSAPVCRDSIDFNRPNCYESDLCSCFHDGYQNIDKHMNANQNSYLINSNGLIAESGYYDSTFYDVFPVKEKPVKTKKYVDMAMKREPRPWTDVRKPTENIPEVAIDPMQNTLYTKCQTLPLSTETNLHKVSKINQRRVNPSVEVIPKRRNRICNINREIKIQESKSCSTFRNAQLQPKIINILPKADKSLEVIQEQRKSDAECLTTFVTSNDCQTGTSIGDDDRINTDVKTENTLNQIKNILQSVLQEVKDTAVSKFSTDEKAKKDAIIQKNASQINVVGNPQNNNLQDSKRENVQSNMPGNTQGNKLSSVLGNMAESQQTNMGYSFSGAVPVNTQIPVHLQGSRFLNSFTYSPYANNSCMPSCSKQLNSNPYCYSPSPAFKYFMNYPVYMHSPERHICASCYRHNSHFKTQSNKVTTIATNTEHITEKNNNETHKLIKEIYKSIAMNVHENNKGICSSKFEVKQKYTDVAKEEKPKKKEQSPPVKEFRKSTNVVQVVSELFRKKEMLVSTDSPNTTALGSMQESIDVILQSSTDIENKFGKGRRDNLSNNNKIEEKPLEICTSTQHSATTSVSETATTTESEVTLVSPESRTIQRSPQEKKEKLGLFSKMIKSVFKQKDKKNYDKKGNSVESIDTEEESSDSDDYQTIYSQKVERPIRYTPKANNFPKRRTHSKISYNKQGTYQTNPSNAVRKSPYMEQEYRRHWTENLMFNEDRRRQSSDLPANSYSYSEFRPPFFQKYEARTAVIQPKNIAYQSIDAKRVIPSKEHKLSEEAKPKTANKRLAWLKNCKFECKKEHWKKLITDN